MIGNCIWSYTVETSNWVSHSGQVAVTIQPLLHPWKHHLFNTASSCLSANFWLFHWYQIVSVILTWFTGHTSQKLVVCFCSGASCSFCCLSRCWAIRWLRRRPLEPWSGGYTASASSSSKSSFVLPE